MLAFLCLLQDVSIVKRTLTDDEVLTSLVDSSMQGAPATPAPSIFEVLSDILRVLNSSVTQLARIAGLLRCLEVTLSRYANAKQALASLREGDCNLQTAHDPAGKSKARFVWLYFHDSTLLCAACICIARTLWLRASSCRLCRNSILLRRCWHSHMVC